MPTDPRQLVSDVIDGLVSHFIAAQTEALVPWFATPTTGSSLVSKLKHFRAFIDTDDKQIARKLFSASDARHPRRLFKTL